MATTARIIQNRKNLSTTLLVTANTSLIVQGNNSVSEIAQGAEVVGAASINQVWFGSPSGNSAYWVVARGSNTVLVLDSTAYLDFSGGGVPASIDRTANISFTLIGSANGFLMIELNKYATDGVSTVLGANSDYIVSGQ